MKEEDKGFYCRMVVENFQRFMHLNYHLWRIDRIMATLISKNFTLDEKKKLIRDALKELEKF